MISKQTREIATIIYESEKELIDADAKFGSDWNKRVAMTIQHLAGGVCLMSALIVGGFCFAIGFGAGVLFMFHFSPEMSA